MRKKIISIFVLLCLCVGMALPAGAVRTEESVERTIRAVGVMVGNASGDLMLDRPVTRAEFITMMTNASEFKDTVGQEGSGYSLFKDVKSSHWASEYIRLGISKGWMVGYTDGTFRPDQKIKLEEACTALLKLLGYPSSSLAGSYPQAQLNKAAALGLRDQLTVTPGTEITRRDCMYLFYNMLTAKTGSGQYYAATLGYRVTNGEVDYTAATWNNVSGPYVAPTDNPALPFTPTVIYRNGEASDSAALKQYDVYYYNTALNALWIYTERVSGKISAIAPNTTEPTSVTVSGVTYPIGSSAATWSLSALGGGAEGASATLLLGMDGKVVDVLTGEQVNASYYGVVRSATKALDTKDGAAVRMELSVACTDGVTRSYTVEESSSFSAGQLVGVQITSGALEIKRLTEARVGGTVNKAATQIGNMGLSDSIEILDTNSTGGAVTLKRERLSGRSLSMLQVRYHTVDENGRIDRLILNDVSGDLWKYGILISAVNASASTAAMRYSVMLGGKQSTISSSSRFAVNPGGIAVSYDGQGAVSAMKNTASVVLTELGTQTARATNRTFTVSENVEIYIKKDGVYYPAKVTDVTAQDYVLTGYYENSGTLQSGQIRLVIATEKSI